MRIDGKRIAAMAVMTAVTVGACSSPGTPSAVPSGGTAAATGAPLRGTVTIDGSSTVAPITEAVAEEFQKANQGVKVTVAIAGTGGGFKKFCNAETDMNDASRPISEAENTACTARSVDYVELQVAIDGLSVLVNPQNTWVDCLTTAELKKIWDQGSTARKWSDVRAGFPAEPIKLFGPGADSGTFDYFTEAINGKAKKSRPDYTQSEDDNALVTGIAGDKGALGYFGFAYFEANKDKLKLIPVDSGKGCVTPSIETIANGTYTPLSRPLFIYPSKSALKRPEFAAFVRYYLDNVNTFVDEVGYIEAPPDVLAKSKATLTAAAQ